MQGYGLEAAVAAFGRSRELFETIVEGLADPGCGSVTHAELEERLDRQGRELLRQLFQDHADLRAVREERQAGVRGADGLERARLERGHGRVLGTVFGEVRIERMAYRAAGASNLHPCDGVWNLPAGKYSHGLSRLVALEAVRGSFETARAAIERATGVAVGKRQVEQLAVAAAADIKDFYCSRQVPGGGEEAALVVLTADGKGVVMRREALREATAKAAAKAAPKLATRVSPGEKGNRKRMAELVCVYDAKPAIRTAADVVGPARAERAEGPKATGKWLTGSVVDDIATVISAGFDEAMRRDPERERTWVVLVDGNNTQIEAITAEARHRHVKINIVVDLIHVIEYVWGAAWSFFDKGDPAAEQWVSTQLGKILDGNARQVAAGIRRRATTYGYHGPERTGADKCATYLQAKAPYLAYDHALAAGWPIATGVIEGACRHLVKDRLDITGARWGLSGAEAILRLRALITTGDFDAYWRFHLHREHDRNHDNRYHKHPADYALAA